MAPTIPPRKGRGALSNPEGRLESRRVAAFDDGWEREDAAELPPLETTVSVEHAKSILTRNDSPDVPFDRTINPYRGCEHGCVYCMSGDTEILMGDGSFRRLGDLRVGDEIYGTIQRGHYRRYVRTQVLAHWATRERAYRVSLADGTTLLASGNHRFLTERGWKFVDAGFGAQRPQLTDNNSLMGFGAIRSSAPRCESVAYQRGYLCGVIRGDGHVGAYRYSRQERQVDEQFRFRLAMVDNEALARTARFLCGFGVSTGRFLFQEERPGRKRIEAIRTSARGAVRTIEQLIHWPVRQDPEWDQGFIAGLFDAEGSYSGGILRIANTDTTLLGVARHSLKNMGFQVAIDTAKSGSDRPVHYLRIRGGLREHLRLMGACNPSIARKRSIEDRAVKSRADLRVVAVEQLPGERDLFDITTGTGDYVANGVISHNCFARPMHSYVNLSPGLDFETRLFYKARAAELLEAELRKRSYVCKPINLGASTDPYQPIERRYKVTRSVLEVLQRFRHPVTIVTKSALVERDIDILSDMARDQLVQVFVSITTLDAALKRTLEPRAPAPLARLRAVRTLHDAGVPVGVLAAPIIPAVNDAELERIIEAAAEAGAHTVGYVLLRLPFEVKDLFREWLQTHLPLRAEHVMSLVQAMRGGRDNDPRFGSRMRGEGPFADLIRRRFETAARRVGLARTREVSLSTSHFRVPEQESGQLKLL